MRPPAALFVVSTVLGSFLLFLLQPMVSKQALPFFGGGAAVWSTALLFFQSMLLLGYALTHATTTRLSLRAQFALHGALYALPLAAFALPSVFSEAHAPPPDRWPVPYLLAALALSVGAPFLALATHSTLTQRLYALTPTREPYFLYAAGNLGSLAALLAYPFALEPRLGLRAQHTLFVVLYAAFVLLALAPLALAARAHRQAAAAPARPFRAPRAQRLRWVFRAGVPSLLLLAVSQRITSDIAAVPLFWTVPLALYLLGYVLAFSPRAPFPRGMLEVLTLYGLAFAFNLWPLNHVPFLAWKLAPPLGALFLASWVVHADLARDRPPPDGLTSFYLHLSLGGALGGLFASLIAPQIFDSIAEYPIALALTAVALSLGADHGDSLARALRRPSSLVGPLVVLAALGLAEAQLRRHAPPFILWNSLPTLALIGSLALWRVPGLFAATASMIALLLVSNVHADARSLAARRSFFGLVRVRESGGRRSLTHGTTLHGIQRVAPFSPVPGTYYHPATPMGAAVAGSPEGALLGVVGLGTGSLAALTRPSQRITFFELDPSIEPIARRWFTFLRDARGAVRVVVGDARLTLARSPERFDLLIIDAFSSDAVPVHLLTREALAMYVSRLRPDGVILFHVSHQSLDLTRVLLGASDALGLAASIIEYEPTESERREGALRGSVVRVSRRATDLAADRRWRAVDPREHPPVLWTDDRSSLLEILGR